MQKKDMLMCLAPGRPWSDNYERSFVPANWQMCHNVNATEDWDGKIVYSTSPVWNFFLLKQMIFVHDEQEVWQ